MEGHRDPGRQPYWARGTQEVSEGRRVRTDSQSHRVDLLPGLEAPLAQGFLVRPSLPLQGIWHHQEIVWGRHNSGVLLAS